MEQYTDDERVEEIRRWWTENGASIIIGILLGLAAIFGWQYWSAYRIAQAEKASQAYEAFIKAADQADTGPAVQHGQDLLADFPKSSYATLAALRLAKLAMDGNDTTTAIQRLEWVINNAKLNELKDIARLRLARVRFAAAQLAEAQKLLDSVTTASLTAEREALKGDLYLAGNDPEKARAAYATALAASGGNRLLQLKLDNLAAPTPDSAIPAPAVPPPPAPPETAAPEPAETAPAVSANPNAPAAEPNPTALPLPDPPEPAKIEPVETTPAPVNPNAPAMESAPDPAPVSVPIPTDSADPAPVPIPTPVPAVSGQ